MVMKLMKKLEDIYVAVTFAEAGEFDTARQIAAEQKPIEKKRPKARKPAKERQLRAE